MGAVKLRRPFPHVGTFPIRVCMGLGTDVHKMPCSWHSSLTLIFTQLPPPPAWSEVVDFRLKESGGLTRHEAPSGDDA